MNNTLSLRTLAQIYSELWLYEICLPLNAIDGNLLKLHSLHSVLGIPSGTAAAIVALCGIQAVMYTEGEALPLSVEILCHAEYTKVDEQILLHLLQQIVCRQAESEVTVQV